MTEDEQSRKAGFSLAEQAPAALYVDEANQDFITGWALHPDGIEWVEVSMNGQRVGVAKYGDYRLDVSSLLPNVQGAAHSGFTFWFDPDTWQRSGERHVEISVSGRTVLGEKFGQSNVLMPVNRFPTRYEASIEPAVISKGSPFPLSITRLLELELGPWQGDDSWSPERVDESVEALIALAASASRETEGLFRYIFYLRHMWSKIDFNTRHFPARNRGASLGDKDIKGIGSGPEELFVICHHLATLHSHGVQGNVCEFGCFKGFSTAVLSEACGRLGLILDVFDSFQGLPESEESTYYEQGEFCGSLEEVQANVSEFGHVPSVRLHPGFFETTIDQYPAARVACIWMDVDLRSSAQDLLRVLPRLDVRSCVFSDECEPEHFLNGEVQDDPHPDRVVEVIRDAFLNNGRAVQGRFVHGHTGVFWDPQNSLSVIAPEPLLRLRDGIV